MSSACRVWVNDIFSSARIVYDHFDFFRMAAQALDEVRKSLRRMGEDLAGGLWAL
jgi:transposase